MGPHGTLGLSGGDAQPSGSWVSHLHHSVTGLGTDVNHSYLTTCSHLRSPGVTLGRGGGGRPGPARPKRPGEPFRYVKWSIQDRAQGGPLKAPSARSRQPGAGRCRPTTPECHSTPYNSVPGPGIVIFWRTGVHQKTHILVTFPPLGVARGGPGGGVAGHPWDTPLGRPGPAQPQSSPNGPGSHLDALN